MRNVVPLCAALCGLSGAAAAEERGLASDFHYSRHVGLTAAHRTLPIGSIRSSTSTMDAARSSRSLAADLSSGARVIDVSLEAADALGFRREGVAHVRIESIGDKLQSGSPGSG